MTGEQLIEQAIALIESGRFEIVIIDDGANEAIDKETGQLAFFDVIVDGGDIEVE